jgi:hypothetical protein
MSAEILPFPAPLPAPVPALQTEPRRDAERPAQDRRGHRDGYRELRAPTQSESRAWRELAAEHEAARKRLNDVLPATAWTRRHVGAVRLSDHRGFDDPAVQSALKAYRVACARFLEFPNPKPRHVLTLLRCAAECAGLPDPVWSKARWGEPESVQDVVFEALFRGVQRALSTEA